MSRPRKLILWSSILVIETDDRCVEVAISRAPALASQAERVDLRSLEEARPTVVCEMRPQHAAAGVSVDRLPGHPEPSGRLFG